MSSKPTEPVKASTSGSEPKGPSFRNEPPLQPTTQVKAPPKATDDFVRTNDPITNKEEERLARQSQEADEEEARRLEEEANQKAEDDQRRADERRKIMQEIVKSPEGFVVRTEKNAEALDTLVTDGTAYQTNVQSGKGGLDVEERVYLAEKGFTQLRNVFGENLGVKK